MDEAKASDPVGSVSNNNINNMTPKDNNSAYDVWFNDVWLDYIKAVKAHRPQVGNKQKAKAKVFVACKLLKKIAEWESDDDLYDWLSDYIHHKTIKDGKYVQNLERWNFSAEDFEEYA